MCLHLQALVVQIVWIRWLSTSLVYTCCMWQHHVDDGQHGCITWCVGCVVRRLRRLQRLRRSPTQEPLVQALRHAPRACAAPTYVRHSYSALPGALMLLTLSLSSRRRIMSRRLHACLPTHPKQAYAQPTKLQTHPSELWCVCMCCMCACTRTPGVVYGS
jgi:hypothetical protein